MQKGCRHAVCIMHGMSKAAVGSLSERDLSSSIVLVISTWKIYSVVLGC